MVVAIQKLIELLRSSAVGLTLLADRLARYVSIADQDVDRALIQGIIKPDEPGLCLYDKDKDILLNLFRIC